MESVLHEKGGETSWPLCLRVQRERAMGLELRVEIAIVVVSLCLFSLSPPSL